MNPSGHRGEVAQPARPHIVVQRVRHRLRVSHGEPRKEAGTRLRKALYPLHEGMPQARGDGEYSLCPAPDLGLGRVHHEYGPLPWIRRLGFTDHPQPGAGIDPVGLCHADPHRDRHRRNLSRRSQADRLRIHPQPPVASRRRRRRHLRQQLHDPPVPRGGPFSRWRRRRHRQCDTGHHHADDHREAVPPPAFPRVTSSTEQRDDDRTGETSPHQGPRGARPEHPDERRSPPPESGQHQTEVARSPGTVHARNRRVRRTTSPPTGTLSADNRRHSPVVQKEQLRPDPDITATSRDERHVHDERSAGSPSCIRAEHRGAEDRPQARPTTALRSPMPGPNTWSGKRSGHWTRRTPARRRRSAPP